MARHLPPCHITAAFCPECSFPGAFSLALKFEKVSQRNYMLIVQPTHREEVDKTVREMLSTAWGEHFRLLWHAGIHDCDDDAR
ncbi:MAG: hypothetical protein IKF78_09135 [Atopobiaceae bacterium]|nr:hypothetical protein [Atopobiaceae bacterium]